MYVVHMTKVFGWLEKFQLSVPLAKQLCGCLTFDLQITHALSHASSVLLQLRSMCVDIHFTSLHFTKAPPNIANTIFFCP